MKTRLIILLLCLPFMGVCQFSSSLDVVVGAAYPLKESSSYAMSIPSIDAPDLILNFSKPVETYKHNWRFGLNFNKQLSDQFYFKTGVRFAYYKHKEQSQNFRTDRIRTTIEPDLPQTDTTGVVFIQNPNQSNGIKTFIYQFSFIEIPIMGRYQFSNKKWSPFVEFGLSPMVLIAQNRLHIYKKIRLAANISAGVNYTPFENLQFFAQPIIRYHFTKMNNNLTFGRNLHSYGIEFGVRRKI